MYFKIQRLKASKLWEILFRTIKYVGITADICVFVGICSLVLFRYVLSVNLMGMDEVVIVFAYWLYFFGASYASMTQTQIKAELIKSYVTNKRVLYLLGFLAKLIESIVTCCFTVWAFRYFYFIGILKWPRTPGLHIPHIFMMFPVFVGYGLMAFFAVCQTIELSSLAFGDYTKYESVND